MQASNHLDVVVEKMIMVYASYLRKFFCWHISMVAFSEACEYYKS